MPLRMCVDDPPFRCSLRSPPAPLALLVLVSFASHRQMRRLRALPSLLLLAPALVEVPQATLWKVLPLVALLAAALAFHTVTGHSR